MSKSAPAAQDPHQAQPVVTAGSPIDEAKGTMILLHGRGASAESILQLAEALERPDFHYLAPQAAGNTWYPYSFLAPIEQNEPYLSSALRRVETLVDQVTAAGVATERLILLGFSQGACLTLEFSARHPRRYGAVVALTGGLIGPDETPRDYAGRLDGVPVFIGSSDPDSHVPRDRVEESARILGRMGASVETRLYPGMPHTINDDELEQVSVMMDRVARGTGDEGR